MPPVQIKRSGTSRQRMPAAPQAWPRF